MGGGGLHGVIHAGVHMSNCEIGPKALYYMKIFVCIHLHRVPQAVYMNYQLKKIADYSTQNIPLFFSPYRSTLRCFSKE